MINNHILYEMGKADSTRHTVYAPVVGHSYAHHPHITYFQGRLIAVWSCGTADEDDCGQAVMISESVDTRSWSTPRFLITPEQTGNKKAVLTAAGFHTDGEKLYVYYGSYCYREDALTDGIHRPKTNSAHLLTDLGYVATTDRIHWDPPKSLGIPMIPNHGPQKTATGRLIIAGNILFPYTDCPNGIDGYRLSGIYGNAFDGKTFADDSESIEYFTKVNGLDARLLCEGAFFQTDDGVLHMMLRSNSGTLWVSESSDDGEEWSTPVPTEYVDDGSKFHFGRLPDGRFYGINNAKRYGGRFPLDLHLSADGVNFDRHYILRDEPYTMQFEGLHKAGVYAYPHSCIHDGVLYVIYSKNKELIEVTRLDLSTI